MLVQETLDRLVPLPGTSLRWTDVQIGSALDVSTDRVNQARDLMIPGAKDIKAKIKGPEYREITPFYLDNDDAYFLANDLEPEILNRFDGADAANMARYAATIARLRSFVEFDPKVSNLHSEIRRWTKSKEVFNHASLQWRILLSDRYKAEHDEITRTMREGDVALLGLPRAEVMRTRWAVDPGIETSFSDASSIYVNTLVAAAFLGTIADYHSEPDFKDSMPALEERLSNNAIMLRQASLQVGIDPVAIGPVRQERERLIRGY